jgi:Prokaryotic E2 family A/Prokaryotic homologs of the JAB domain/ThiF family
MADLELFSSSLTDLDPASVPIEIQVAFSEMSLYPRARNLRLVRWDATFIGIVVELPVQRPSRGTPSGADIRHWEPMLFLLHERRYSLDVPRVWADRKDFPTDLPHLNPVWSGQPQSLCLHRGSLNDWFAEHSLHELVDRARQWLRDAAYGTLIPEGDRFEVTRLVGSLGLMVYPYAEYTEVINSNSSSEWMPIFLEFLGKQDLFTDALLAFNHSWFPDQGQLETVRDICVRNNKISKELQQQKSLLGMLLWPTPDRISSRYFGVLPSNLGELVVFANDIGIDLESILKSFLERGAAVLKGIPILIAVRRPSLLIGKETNLEILHFVVIHTETEGVSISPDAQVFLLNQVEPMTPASARRLSRRDEDQSESATMILGTGALGSKVALHRGRGGDDALTLVETDTLSPHNLVRHALLRDGLGQNKAVALRNAIGNLFQGGPDKVGVKVLERDALDILAEGPEGPLASHQILLDCTASQRVLRGIVQSNIPESCRVVRAEIADLGRLGFWTAEGPNRSPRLDDLQYVLFAEGLKDDLVSRWLREHRQEREALDGPALEEISLGVSCSTTTLRLADDVISYHAAAVSLGIRDLPEAGEVGIISWAGEGGQPASIKRLTVSATIVCQPEESRDWQVRFLGPAVEEMRLRFHKAGHAETGGILFGRYDFKRKIVYVAVASPPPRDSVGLSSVFMRGTFGLWDHVTQAHESTGGLIDYVGEWHTHPRGPGSLSPKDWQTVHELEAMHKTTGFPTLVTIITPRESVPHLFVP